MAKKKNKKVIRYPRSFHINVGMIIFFLIFVYMAFYVSAYIRRDKVQFYEVEAGGIVNDRSYTGLILRQEDVKYTDRAGYINYYIREGKRASVGSRVYSLDETGSLAGYLEKNPNAGGQLVEEDLADLKRQLSAFSLSYQDIDFSEVSDAKYSLEASVMEYMNFSNMENLDAALASAGINFQQVRSNESGIISYAIDGFSDTAIKPAKKSDKKKDKKKEEKKKEEKKEDDENKKEESGAQSETDPSSQDEAPSGIEDREGENSTAGQETEADESKETAAADSLEEDKAYAEEQAEITRSMTMYSDITASNISEDLFDKSKYIRNITKSGQLIGKGVPVYKVISSENWSVVFQMTEDDVKEYGDRQTLDVLFGGHGLTMTGKFSMIAGTDGKTYGKLDFDKYMVQFASDRFINFEIISEEVKGLKIPVSAVTSKDFFLVPVDYISQGGDSSKMGFMKEIYSEKGTSVQFVPADVYYSTEEYYYINKSDSSELKEGDYIVKPGSASDRFQIGQTASLQGVYNINKGYAVFRQIEVLTSNDEYYTVEKGTKYGLSVYDHIVLNADTVQEGELIYQ
ncbi:HlyD family efflux transporter periplasmic adaptor subunit [Clostridium sp. AM58-1XD]|uniref:HlyD family efflux transporter periplasmic adaptor subunit n=1 Tax=Clostridium sp. AM58-1XD TaxID=2292307 RepID=UPI000E533D21|nr:HlyD family efflux transporter periplasmic adaptor subunit [Clostridium sp. AM58-1XD]RGZ01472.1 hypothetical protein DXA13_01055 [Clostridium sp. AM58-1XD]